MGSGEFGGHYCNDGQRFAELEKQMAVLEHEISDLKQHQNVVIEQQGTLIARCTYALWGHNGEAGVVLEVDRLKHVNIPDRLKSLETTINRWLGGMSFAMVAIPLLIKIFWP